MTFPVPPPISEKNAPSLRLGAFFDALLRVITPAWTMAISAQYAAAGPDLHDAGVAAVAGGVLGADLVQNSFLATSLLGQVGQGLAVVGQIGVSLARVIIFSAMGATSLARETVVLIWPFSRQIGGHGAQHRDALIRGLAQLTVVET